VSTLVRLLGHRRRPEPPLDVGLAAERTAMAWQRTALALAAFSALLVHLADSDLMLAAPGLGGLALALALLVMGERRYATAVRRVEQGGSPLAQGLARLVTGGLIVLSIVSLVFVVVVET
jgi:putative membrane protein